MKTMRLLLPVGWLISLGYLLGCAGCKPEKPNVLNIRMEAAATILNPLLRSTGYSGYVAAQIFQTFGTLDPDSLVMKPSLAQTVPIPHPVTSGPHQGELGYEIEIQEAAKWDNGSPITAEDFVFTLKLIFNQGLDTRAYRGYYEYLSGADIDPANPKKFTVYMRQYYILAQEALCSTPVYPMYNYDPNGRLKNVALADFIDPVKSKAFAESEAGKAFAEEFSAPKYSNDPQFVSGSGPYRLKSINGDQGVILIRKKDWWANKVASATPMLAAYPEQLVYKIVKNEDAVRSLLQTGDLDIVTDLSPGLFKELQQDTHLTRMYDFKTGWAPRYGRMLLNVRRSDTSLLSDIRVRRALAYMIDYDYLINTVQQGFAQPTVGPIHPAKAYYGKDVPRYTYKPEEAKRLLAEAG
ncbi:MAG: ABC transporter substrate-binding protein, partial [Saprospiraceae bacterium]